MQADVPDILRSLRCDRRAHERRRWARVGWRARVRITTLDDRVSSAWMRDLSEGGAGLLVSCPLRLDQSLLLNFAVEKKDELAVRCRVIHCQKAGGFWRVGVQFVNRPWRDHKPTVRAGGPATWTLDAKRIKAAILDL